MEVFTLNNLLCTMFLHQLVNYIDNPTWKNIEKGVFVSGLCLTNQHTSILFIAPVAIFIAISNRRDLDAEKFKRLLICAAVPLSAYLYLPFSAFFSNGKFFVNHSEINFGSFQPDGPGAMVQQWMEF